MIQTRFFRAIAEKRKRCSLSVLEKRETINNDDNIPKTKKINIAKFEIPPITLKNIKMEYLPQNTTSELQPLDQDIIRSFKMHYRKEVVRRLHVESQTATTIDVLQALWMNLTVQ